MRQRIFYITVLLCLALGSAQAKEADVAKLKTKVGVYLKRVEAQPDWLVSRLHRFYPYEAGTDNLQRVCSAWLVAVGEGDGRYKGAVQAIKIRIP